MMNGAGTPVLEVSLADRVRGGEEGAEEEFVIRFHRRVYVMALARTRDPEVAEDLAQEVMLGVLQGLREGRLIDGEKLSAYVHGTARNLINNTFRSRHQQPVGPLPIGNPFEDAGEGAANIEHRTLAGEAIAVLRPTDRAILCMTLVEGLRSEEAAERLQITPEAVRKRKSRALARARDVIRGRSRK